MDIYLRTRGLDKDYRFAGEAPSEFWWRKYRAWTDTEGPTILVESDENSWRAYIAGISSVRRDLSDRPIQFNLALAGPHSPDDPQGRDIALAVLGRSVADLADQGGGSISGKALDEVLPQDVVERMLASPGEETWLSAAAAVRTAYEADVSVVGELVVRELDDVPPAWAAGVANPRARELFVGFAAALLGGRPGLALVLNLLANADDAAQVVAGGVTGSGVAVLASRPGSVLDEEVTELAVKKGELPPVSQPYQDSRPYQHSRPARTILAVLVTVVVLAALVILATLTLGLIRI